MRLKNLENMHRLLAWIGKNYAPELHSEIIRRLTDDKFPPYEFWEGLWHPHQGKMQKMVARGIAKWLEQQHVTLQFQVLNLLDPSNHHNELYAQMGLEKACSVVYARMNPEDWLKRHAVICSERSAIWMGAMEYIRLAILHDAWYELTNYKAEFFMEVSDGD
jgi:hypothetical protein